MAQHDLAALWEPHCRHEFETRHDKSLRSNDPMKRWASSEGKPI